MINIYKFLLYAYGHSHKVFFVFFYFVVQLGTLKIVYIAIEYMHACMHAYKYIILINIIVVLVVPAGI